MSAAERDSVRYHDPRERSPVPAVLVAVLVLVTTVSAQLSLAGGWGWTAPLSTAAADPGDGFATPDGDRAGQPSQDEAPPGGGAGEVGSAVPDPRLQVELTFDTGSDVPAGDPAGVLGPVVAALLVDPMTRVRVVGHAEPSGDPVLEEQISLRRAGTVVALLEERGVPAERIEVYGAGASETGLSVAGTDRRVSVSVLSG